MFFFLHCAGVISTNHWAFRNFIEGKKPFYFCGGFVPCFSRHMSQASRLSVTLCTLGHVNISLSLQWASNISYYRVRWSRTLRQKLWQRERVDVNKAEMRHAIIIMLGSDSNYKFEKMRSVTSEAWIELASTYWVTSSNEMFRKSTKKSKVKRETTGPAVRETQSIQVSIVHLTN